MRILISMVMTLGVSAVWATDIPALPHDPTLPPSGLFAEDGSMAAQSVSGLTSVILPKHGKPAAVIDGQIVPLGGTVRDARLVRISESGVVLQGADSVERLLLTPSVEKSIKTKRGAPR